MKVISTRIGIGKNHMETLCSEVGITREEARPIVYDLTQAEDPHTGIFHIIVEDDYELRSITYT